MCSSGTAFFVDLDQKATVHSRRNTLRWRKRAGKGHVFIFELKKKHWRSHIIAVLQWGGNSLFEYSLPSSLNHYSLLHSNLVPAHLMSKVKLEQNQQHRSVKPPFNSVRVCVLLKLLLLNLHSRGEFRTEIPARVWSMPTLVTVLGTNAGKEFQVPLLPRAIRFCWGFCLLPWLHVGTAIAGNARHSEKACCWQPQTTPTQRADVVNMWVWQTRCSLVIERSPQSWFSHGGQ